MAVDKTPHNNKERLKTLGAEPGTILSSRWLLHTLIAGGGFGQIFVATDLQREYETEIAVKVEPRDAAMALLATEAEVLTDLNARLPRSKNFLKILHFGETPLVHFLVMTRAGRNLRDVKKATHGDRLSARSTLTLGHLMLGAIEQMHSVGWLHRDVKPSNFCLYERACGHLLLLDFGLSRRYIDAQGKLKPARDHSGFHGTTRYASPRTHKHLDMGRCDDVWPLFFLLCEMVCGQLPWRQVSVKDTVLQMKEAYEPGTRLRSLHALRRSLLLHQFYTQIDYRAIAKSFLDDLSSATELDTRNHQHLDMAVEQHYQLCALLQTVPVVVDKTPSEYGPQNDSARSNTFASCATSTLRPPHKDTEHER